MKILACDTALGALSAAVNNDGVLTGEWTEMSRGHAEALAPMVERVMRDAGLAFAALDQLAVTTGPGTFTGQRVGLAFMRAAALALKVPLVGITTLNAMCAEALASGDAKWAVAVADAKRGEVYIGALGASGEEILEAALISFDAAAANIAHLARKYGEPLLAGTATEAMLAALSAQAVAAHDSGVRQPDAVFVAALAANKPAPDSSPKPLYLRAPDAKLPK